MRSRAALWTAFQYGKVVAPQQCFARRFSKLEMKKLWVSERAVQLDQQAANRGMEERRTGGRGNVARQIERARVPATVRRQQLLRQ